MILHYMAAVIHLLELNNLEQYNIILNFQVKRARLKLRPLFFICIKIKKEGEFIIFQFLLWLIPYILRLG